MGGRENRIVGEVRVEEENDLPGSIFSRWESISPLPPRLLRKVSHTWGCRRVGGWVGKEIGVLFLTWVGGWVAKCMNR